MIIGLGEFRQIAAGISLIALQPAENVITLCMARARSPSPIRAGHRQPPEFELPREVERSVTGNALLQCF
jgi:hypothetical protein